MSRRRFSLAIRPAGSSLPELIRKPVLKRSSEVCNSAFDRARVFWAIKLLTFVLMRLIHVTPLELVDLPWCLIRPLRELFPIAGPTVRGDVCDRQRRTTAVSSGWNYHLCLPIVWSCPTRHRQQRGSITWRNSTSLNQHDTGQHRPGNVAYLWKVYRLAKLSALGEP